MLKLLNLTKSFEKFRLQEIYLEVHNGDYFVCLGPSGSGKTLLLKILSGLMKPDAGKIYFNNIDVTHLPMKYRKFILVFQEDHLFPHLNVYENLKFAAKLHEKNSTKLNDQIMQIATETKILHLLSRDVLSLSGGEKQRVSLARALLSRPNLLLLDEPLSSVDVQLKFEIQQLLRLIHRKGLTLIHVTHDVHEALSLATKVAIIDNGKILQYGTPEDIFKSPSNQFVASLLGYRNFILCEISEKNSEKYKIARPLTNRRIEIKILTEHQNSQAYIVIDSRNIIISSQQIYSSALNSFKGVIKDIITSVYDAEILVDIGILLHVQLSKESISRLSLASGKDCWVTFKASSCVIVPR